MENKLLYLIELRKATMLVSIVAEKDILERNRKVFATKEQLKKVEKHLQEARQVERSIIVLEIVREKVMKDIKEV